MTNPTLSIATTNSIGRVYQLPEGTHGKKMSGIATRKALAAGTVFPSITNVISVMSKDFTDWQLFMMSKALRVGNSVEQAMQAGNNHRDFAAARGTAVHNLIDEYVLAGNGKRGTFLPAFKSLPGWSEVQELGGEGYMRAFINFCKDNSPEFIQTESTVYGSTSGRGLDYAGTLDAVVLINGNKLLLDWKCVSKLSPGSVSRQLAAGVHASHYYNTKTGLLKEWDGAGLAGAAAVRLCADESYEVKTADSTRGWNEFKTLRSLWDSYALGDDDMLTDASHLFTQV